MTPGRRIAASLLALLVACGGLFATAFGASASTLAIETRNAPWSGDLGFVDEDRSQGRNGYYSRHWMHGWNANGDYVRSLGKWAPSGQDSRAPWLGYDYRIGGYYGDFARDM